jgi:8-oxo-dGTP pyrophosphatase MutT (NUDIX family)
LEKLPEPEEKQRDQEQEIQDINNIETSKDFEAKIREFRREGFAVKKEIKKRKAFISPSQKRRLKNRAAVRRLKRGVYFLGLLELREFMKNRGIGGSGYGALKEKRKTEEKKTIPAIKYWVSVFIVIRIRGIDSEGHFILIKDKDQFKIKFPGGKVEPGEEVEEAAVREGKEETGINLLPEFFGEIEVSPGKFVGLFKADIDPLTALNLKKGEEQEKIYILSKKEVEQLVIDRKIMRNHINTWNLYKSLFNFL